MHVQSPSFTTRLTNKQRAFELKFLLDLPTAHEVQSWTAERLMLDPHGDNTLGGAYQTTTLYLDTPQHDVYFRSPTYARRKYRIRRYGAFSTVFLERKTKRGDRVSKRRTRVNDQDLRCLHDQRAEGNWSGSWFLQRVVFKGLRPACLIRYERSAFVGVCNENPLRLTIDRGVHGAPCNHWTKWNSDGEVKVLSDQAILELKFRAALPLLFKDVVRRWALAPAPVSKYRALCDTLGIGTPQRRGDTSA